MKKQTNRGCIYWDESSRGKNCSKVATDKKRGRWVGERLESGKRVRMRSTDYEKVLQWVTDNDRAPLRQPLPGFEGYSIDIGRREVIGKRGQILRPSIHGGQMRYKLYIDGVPHDVSFNRMAYATLHHLEVHKIPSDIIVDYRDGQYTIHHASDYSSQINDTMRTEKLHKIDAILAKRKREIEILQRFYTTHHSEELTTYVMQEIFDNLVAHVAKTHFLNLSNATERVMEASERFLSRAIEGNIPLIAISSTIMSLCRTVRRETFLKCEYDDNKRH